MLPAHQLKIVLVEPEIPQNAGNVARLCAATGAALHLVRPLGFFLSDKHFKRAGMDYIDRARIIVHDDLPALMRRVGPEPVMLSSGLAGGALWAARFPADAWLFLGRESAGLPADLLAAYPNAIVRIPMLEHTRGLNLATAAGILLYEALRQVASATP